MNYRIETKESFPDRRREGALSDERGGKLCPGAPVLAGKTVQSGEIPSLLAMMDREPYGLLGVSTCMDGRDFDYYIAVSTNRETPENMEEYIVPACTWAVFECVGPMPAAIQNLQKRIISEWLPNSRLRIRERAGHRGILRRRPEGGGLPLRGVAPPSQKSKIPRTRKEDRRP